MSWPWNISPLLHVYTEGFSKRMNRTRFPRVNDYDEVRTEEAVQAKGFLAISSWIGTKLLFDSGAHVRAMLSTIRDDAIAEGVALKLVLPSRSKRGNETDIGAKIDAVSARTRRGTRSISDMAITKPGGAPIKGSQVA